MQTNFKQDIGYEFVNGEYFRSKDGILVSSYSRIKSLVMVWWVDNVKYTGHFYFDEDEVLKLFDNAYGLNRKKQGEFVIRIGKYNNRFDIILRVGEKEFRFEKTQIHVFRRTPEDDKGYNFYDNYRGEKVRRYVGE